MLPNYFFFSFLMQTITINAFKKKKIYNAIYVVHFLITSILHKPDIRVPLGVPKSSRLENSKSREKSTEWFEMNKLLLDGREIEIFYEHRKHR